MTPFRRLSINNQIFLYIVLILLFFTGIILFIQYNREKEFRKGQLESTLINYNSILYNSVSSDLEVQKLVNIIRLFPDTNIRVSIFDKNGNVLFDSQVEQPETLLSHADRPEFIDAQKNGIGRSIRLSNTTKQKYYYLLQNFGEYNIRTALPYNVHLMEILKDVNLQFFYLVGILFLFVLLGIWYMSRIFYKVFIQLKNIASRVENKEPFVNAKLFHIDELNEASEYIANTYNKLCKVKDELVSEKEKLFKHLYLSKEGLAIFSENRQHIIVNELFIQYINLISVSQLKEPEGIFILKEFSGITAFLDKNENNELLRDDIVKENLLIESNNRTFSVQCILFEDKSFEISINDVTQQEEQYQIKRQLTQNIAHELKTPVSSIMGYLETIINFPQLEAERRQFYIERTYAQANRLSHLVSEILLLNKIDSGSEFFEKTTLNLSEIIRSVLNDATLQIEQKHVKLNLRIKEALEMEGNRLLLYSIFRNLIDNSLAYAGENFEIILDCYREDENKYYFCYADTGTGVSKEHINRIFDRFYRIDKGRSRKAGGTGLGLAIVKNAIIFHKGMIGAKNRDGGGLEFLFTLEKK